MQNLVTIIIPTFNRAETLPKTLRSVQNQSHQNWECLVIDDGSEDQTEKILQEFLKDNRFRFLKRPEDRKKVRLPAEILAWKTLRAITSSFWILTIS